MTSRRLCGFLLLLSLAVCSVPTVALADDAERIERLNKKAMEDYDALEFESARRTLVDCVAKLRSAGLDETPLAAKTHIHLGIVYIAGFKDRGRGQQQFERALKIDPTLKLDPALATPELQEVWDAAVAALPKKKRAQASQTPPPAPAQDPLLSPTQPQSPPKGQETDAPAAPAEALSHVPVDEVGAGQKVNIYAKPLQSIARAVLFYRAPGQAAYAQAEMGRSRKVPGEIVGQVPAGVTAGRSFQYYIEAYDAAGAVVGRQGSPESPFVVLVSGGKAARPVEDDREDPLAQVRREQAAARAGQPRRDWVYVDVGLGAAFAAIPSGTTTEVAWYYDRMAKAYNPAVASTGGGIFAGMALRAELGVFAYKGLSIGPSFWFEAYLNHNADSSAGPQLCTKRDGGMTYCYAPTTKGNFGVLGLAKVRYQFRRNTVFRPYIHFDLGGGTWRGALNIDGSIDNSSPLQPTDVCSATYNGKLDPDRAPAGCSSVGQVPGYNLQDPRPATPNLNRVCPTDGPCIDAVLLGNFALGGGAGFYVGGKHAGFSLDGNIILLFGGAQFGALFAFYAGPQFIF
jgi:hypothetical protein